MILHGPDIDPPTLHRVATFALRTELAFVKIGVTIGAARSGFGKNVRDVARSTGHTGVLAAQGEARFRVVIEFDLRAKRRKAGGGVAVLAGDRQASMRRCNSALAGQKAAKQTENRN